MQVVSISTQHGRRELIATCARRGRRYQIALLDVEVQADPATDRLITAYHRWAGFR